jgi:hypothetical protein
VIGWLILLGYLAGGVAVTLRLAKKMLQAEARSRGKAPDGEDRVMMLTLAGLISIVWPLVVAFWVLSYPFRGAVRAYLTTDLEHRQARDKELAELRALAKEHGLPLPDDDPTGRPDGTVWCGVCQTRHRALNRHKQ